ncbi:MAG: GNAT family N-acetyltransferase [Coriobacteriia bacterium]|nr:GNAT family N-acetyltransferase [Coriobacteriia bacterium]
MQKDDVEILFNIASRSFRPDYDKYGVYPPFMRLKQKKFLPPRMFGKTILADNAIIGGAFVMTSGKKGVLGSIFLDPQEQRKGYGRQAMLTIEALYPKVSRWKLDTLAESHGLHRFYESLGYVRVGEMEDKASGLKGFVYEKAMGPRP